MILSDNSLYSLASEGMVTPFEQSNVQGSSIDLTLGNNIKVEAPTGSGGDWFEIDLSEQGYSLDPGEFILAHTEEVISVPEGCAAMVLLRSSAARAGYEHSLAGWCDPGFKGQITLELRNNLRFRHLPVKPGMRLCQLVVHKLDQHAANPYCLTGHYQNQMGVTASNNNFRRVA